MSKKIKLFGSFEKVEAQEDGTVKVYGYASSEAVDSQGEIVSAEAMKAAMPDYLKFGNVREMHGPSAAGTCVEMAVKEDGRTWFGAHVVDPVAVKKVEAGVYKGFSIGGRVLNRDETNKSIITSLRLSEISLVDRPSNPDSLFTCVKMDDPEDKEEDAVEMLATLLSTGKVSATRLADLAKAEVDPPAPVADAPVKISKGMYEVARLAELTSCVNDLRRSAEWEAEYEGDGSPIPGKLKACVNALAECLAEMVVEETSEMLAAADTGGDMKKMDDMQKAFDAMQASVGELTKALAAQNEQLAKAATEGEELRKRLGELEAQPAPPTAALLAVDKGQEVAMQETKPDDETKLVRKADGTVDEAASIIKAIHQRGGVRVAA